MLTFRMSMAKLLFVALKLVYQPPRDLDFSQEETRHKGGEKVASFALSGASMIEGFMWRPGLKTGNLWVYNITRCVVIYCMVLW